MTRILVCPLSQVPAMLEASSAGWVVSLLALAHRLPDLHAVPLERRLHLAVSDIAEATPDYILAQHAHLDALLAFLRRWDRASPLLIHCYAGVSRSTAAAYVAACLLDPTRSEAEHARWLRAASPTATPNRRIVELADAALGRGGRMVRAIAGIGRGAECFEGVPFTIPVPARDGA